MVVTKPGVRLVFTPAILKITETLMQFDQAPLRGQPADLVITAGCDGVHLPESKHYLGAALDVRSKTFAPELKLLFRAELEKTLGALFRVLLEDDGLESEHYHVQTRAGVWYAGNLTSPIAEEYRV